MIKALKAAEEVQEDYNPEVFGRARTISWSGSGDRGRFASKGLRGRVAVAQALEAKDSGPEATRDNVKVHTVGL